MQHNIFVMELRVFRSGIYIVLLPLLAVLSGCEKSMSGSEVEVTINSIVGKIESEAKLSQADKCIADFVVSSVIDKNNFVTYGAAFDVLARLSVVNAVDEINYCRPIVQGAKNSRLLGSLSEKCPEKLKKLTSKEFDELLDNAEALSLAAGNFSGSVFELAFGSCVN